MWRLKDEGGGWGGAGHWNLIKLVVSVGCCVCLQGVLAADVEDVQPRTPPHLEQTQLLPQQATVSHHQADVVQQLRSTSTKLWTSVQRDSGRL